MDRIIIRDLLVRCIIGIFEEERRDRQDVIINAVLHTDLSKAGSTDDFADTVDYKAVKKRIFEAVAGSRFMLIERLADLVASICLEDPRVEEVTVTVDKPGALRFAKSVAVEITRRREGG